MLPAVLAALSSSIVNQSGVGWGTGVHPGNIVHVKLLLCLCSLEFSVALFDFEGLRDGERDVGVCPPSSVSDLPCTFLTP